MKKLHLIVQQKDVKETLDELCQLGTLHVEHQAALGGDQLTVLRDRVADFEAAVNALKECGTSSAQEDLEDPDAKVEEILSHLAKISQCQDSVVKIDQQIKQWEVWGDFDPEDIRALAERGTFIHLYEKNVSDKTKIPDDIIFKVIARKDKKQLCVAISTTDEQLPFIRIYPPTARLKEMIELKAEQQKNIEEAQGDLTKSTKYLSALEKTFIEAKERLTFEEVAVGMDKEENLVVLKGFVPEDKYLDVESYAKEQQWAILVEDPSKDDNVPTLLRNPKWVNVVKPVFNLLEIMPGYKEFDVSMIMLVFFSIFAGMLVGDAAYGVIYAAFVFFLQKKLGGKLKDKTTFNLLYLLSFTAIVWGVLTGTFFGQQWLQGRVEPILPWLNNYTNIQFLCFTIAIIHLSIARLWSAASKFPSTVALSDLGWLSILWGMYFLANYFVLNMPMPSFAKYFFFTGIALALIFMAPLNEALQTIPKQIIPFSLSVIGAFTDIVSYIRLFAVGLATVAVADAANAMAAQAPAGMNVIVLFIFHTLNIILAAMAILVHGIRLNVLEFSGHLSLEWTGFKYNPFRKQTA